MQNNQLCISEEPPVLESFLEKYRRSGAKLVFYGAGAGLARFASLFQSYQIEPDFICDGNPNKQGTLCSGKKVCQIGEVLDISKDLLIVLTTVVYHQEIRKYLIKECGIPPENIYYFPVPQPLHKLAAEKALFAENRRSLDKVFESLGDNKSRCVLENVLNGRITGDQKFFLSVYEDHQYFCPELVQLAEDEVFIDGGAFCGDTINDFMRFSKGRFAHISAFEPEPLIFQELQKNHYAAADDRIQIYQKGLYSSTGKIFFDPTNAGSGGACITKESSEVSESIDTVSIDSLCYKNVTFIKLDIEGSELEALKGAEETIRKYRPKLAVCIYHKPEDFFEIPLYILSLHMKYRLYIRHHSDMINETVLYAL